MEKQTTDVESIVEFRELKKKLEAAATTAKAEMQDRYSRLLGEAALIQAEFKAHFGTALSLPGTVKAFTLVPAEGKTKPAQSEAAAKGKKIGGLKRSLTAATKKGDKAKQADIIQQLAALGVDATADPLAPENTL